MKTVGDVLDSVETSTTNMICMLQFAKKALIRKWNEMNEEVPSDDTDSFLMQIDDINDLEDTIRIIKTMLSLCENIENMLKIDFRWNGVKIEEEED